jgi:hypothetical protein
VEANSTGGQGSRRAVAPTDDDDSNSVHIITSAAHAVREIPTCTESSAVF